jgi:hypothetical protein
MIRGMMTEVAFNRIVDQRKDNAAKAGAKNLANYRAHTWDKAERSATITLKILNGMPCASEEEHAWREDVREIVYTTLHGIREKKKKHKAPLDVYLFWYDVDGDAMRKFRELIKKYPGENCPVTVM